VEVAKQWIRDECGVTQSGRILSTMKTERGVWVI